MQYNVLGMLLNVMGDSSADFTVFDAQWSKWGLRCVREWWSDWAGWKSSQAHTAATIVSPFPFFMEVSQWSASIDSHAWPVSSAVTPLCMDPVHWEPCLAQCAKGRGISVGFQRKDDRGIWYALKIIASSSSQWTGAVLICKHCGWGRTWMELFVWVCFVVFFH